MSNPMRRFLMVAFVCWAGAGLYLFYPSGPIKQPCPSTRIENTSILFIAQNSVGVFPIAYTYCNQRKQNVRPDRP